MYLGRIAADIPLDGTVTRETLVELITAGSSGSYGIQNGQANGIENEVVA
jgi:hypothetical protein